MGKIPRKSEFLGQLGAKLKKKTEMKDQSAKKRTIWISIEVWQRFNCTKLTVFGQLGIKSEKS